ncbi:MAG: ABC transporter substrate-binding protein [Anaerolineae bacterium]
MSERFPRGAVFLEILVLLGLLGACERPTPPPTTPTTPKPSPTPYPTATLERSEIPQELVLCMTEPPAASPFLPSQSGSDLLALFYEEPVERVGYQWEPRLVERVPALKSGDVMTRSVPVTTGARYADALGLVQQYTGTETIELPQLTVTFTLTSDLLWSDGTPITTKDAILGYHLAQAPEAQGRWRRLAERTARFVAVDEHTVRWEGIPGYLEADYPGFLFPLQPAHRWGGQSLTAVLQDRTPPATGAFRIVAWEAQREARLEPNPNYSGAAPILRKVTVRFPQNDPNSWDRLLAEGTCDVVLPDPILVTTWQQWAQLGTAGEAIIWADATSTVLRLDLNLGGPSPDASGSESDERASPLQQLAVRQALSACVDRERLAQALPSEALTGASGFVPPNHPANAGEEPAPADVAAARQLLARAGWRDEDADGIREAHNVPGITDGEPLSMTMHFASPYFVLAAHIAADLETCGVKVTLQPTDFRQLYTSGAASPLFGRRFEMALLGWQSTVPQACGTWLSDRIPDEENGWTGENFSGFTSKAYDEACRRALTALDGEGQAEGLHEALTILNQAKPTLFLAWRPFWFAARPRVQGLRPDASAYGTIWNIEEISIGQ